MAMLEAPAATPEVSADPRDCSVCRCLDIKADQAWVTDETGTYRNESALSDVLVKRRQHRDAGPCARPLESW